ncbi:LamG-like jellyroll fold domain-containing protein [Niastella vici]|nr:LamG-like jellyroll fold domain-containing protein [Niastella vici]
MRSSTHAILQKTKLLRYVWVTGFTFLLGIQAMAQHFVHPGIPFTRYDLNQLKANITKEPWLSAYNAFKGDYRSQLSYTGSPQATVTRAPNLNNTIWINDMVAVHHLAFMWIFTGDSAYARRATDLLDAWAVTNTVWGGNESMLDIGDYAQYWATGADILRGTFPGWTDSNTIHVRNYFANVLYPTAAVPYPLRDANKGALQLKIALAAAAFLDDATKFNQAIDVYRMDAGGGMRNSLTNGEVGDAGRDDHWRVQAAALVWGAEVAYKQGIDMYEELDKRVLAIGELYNKYSFEGDTMTYIPMGGYASFWTSWGITTGARQADYTNILHGAYKLRKGIATPYNDMMRAALMQAGTSYYTPAGGDFLYLKSSDTSTAVTLPPIYYPAEHVQPVSNLTNVDIGNPGIAGNASYSNGVWTVNAAGNSTSSAFNYTFKKMSGDAGLVVKVNSMSLSSSGCGVMIRQSLAPGSTFYDIYLAATGGVGRHWQPKAPWWLKIERVGNRIFTYHSPDGVNWTGLGCWYSPSGYTSDLYYGFYTLSNNTSALNTAVFTNVGFSQAAPAGSPDISSATSATATVGSLFNYTITANGSPTIYSASGLPSGLSIDAATGVISGTPAALGQSEITLTATNGSGTGTATLMLNVIGNSAPAVPDSLIRTVVNTTQINLTWKSSTNATSYSVKRSLTAGGPYTTIQTGINITSFTDAAPVPEVNNYYVVTALTGTLESGASNEVFAAVPPAIPGKPVVISKNGQIDLSWSAANGAASYKVKRSLTTGGPYTVIAQVSANSYSDLNVANGTGYYYVVSSMGSTSESANSLESFGVPGSNSSTWSSDPDSEVWSEAANWMENSVPQSPAILTFRSTADSVLTNDLTNLEVSRMLFDTTANAYTINGNSFTLKTDLVNASSNTQTITTPITINNQVNVTAGSTIKYTSILSGSGGLTKNGSGVLHLSGQNTYSGNTILNGAVAIAGTGTGTPGSPITGPLGTGKIIMNGGTIWSGDSAATIYNDIEVAAGIKSYLLQTTNAITLYGRLTGSGTLWEDGNDYPGINLWGDNSGFTGTFVAALRSGKNRVRFSVPESGSANAFWNLDANGIDCIGIGFKTGTLHFGALTGRGYIRNDAGGTPTISIGALNQSTWFGGTLANYFDVVKVGTGTLLFTGNHTYGGTTTIKNGTFLLLNSSTNGAFASPIIDSSGTFGGTGLSQAAATIGTGSAANAYLAPGDGGIGTLTVAGLTMNSNATYNLEVSTKKGTADKMKASGVSLVGNPVLSVTDIDTGALALGTNFTILENTGANAISGAFKNMPEMSIVKLGSYDLRITYKGGDGNDVVLMDDRATPVIITSAKADTALVGRAYQYTITGIKSPKYFHAAALPSGLAVDTTTGVISGTPNVYGNFNVVLQAANDTLSGTDTLRLVVLNNVTSNVAVAEGDARVVVEWNSILNFTYKVKRSVAAAGPFTVIATTSTAKYTDSLLSNGTTYYYTVTAVDSSKEYPESAPVAATPKLGQWGYWKFNEASGTKAFDVWGANHGVLQAAAGRDTGFVSNGLKLNGSGTSYALLPNGIFSSLNDFTAMAWIKPKSLSTWMRVFDFGSSTNQYFFLTPQAAVTSDGKQTIRYAIKNNGTEQGLNFIAAIPLNDWTHLAVTQSGNTCTIYINGVAVISGTITIKPSNLGSTTQNYVGKSQWSDPLYNGIIDELKVYNRALSKTELNTAAGIFADTAMKARSYKYTVVSPISSPTQFVATGLPSGFTINAGSGEISGTTDTVGQFKVVVTVSNGATSGISTINLEVLDNVLKDVLVAAGDSKAIVEWNPLSGLSYSIKRATSANGPFTVIGTTTAIQYTDNSVTNGTTYYYQVVAKDSVAEYATSNIVEATPGPGQWDYWKFNDSTGTRAVDSWGARHGTLTGGISSTNGLQGKAIQLNGSNGYVTLPSGLMSAVTDFTIAGWVKLTASSTWARLFDFGTGSTNYMFLSPVSGSNTVRYAIKVNGGSEQQINSAAPLPAGEWHHVAVTLSGTLGTLYIDGVAAGTNSGMSNKPSALGTTNLNYIGKSQFGSDAYLNSIVDEFRIYNRALSAAEMKTLYTQFAPPLAPTNLVVTASNSKPALSWTASSGATSYNVKRAGTLAGPYTTIATAASANYTDTSAASCASYFYVVSASNSNGESANSIIATLAGKKLTGTVIGTDGSFNSNGNTKANALDGNLSTYFDGPTANGVWVGYDLGADSTQAVFKIRYAPRTGFGSRMVGGVFQGSNVASFSTATTLFTIAVTPADGVYTEKTITSTAAYRYIRYLAPNAGYGNVAEAEFYGIASAAVPQITSKAGTKNLSYGTAFSYTIPATNTNNFSATGLPNGLSLDACTGVISGTLNAAGTFPVILTASSTLGSAKDTMQLIIKKDQTITFNALLQKKIGDADFNAGAVASSGLAVSYTSSDTTVSKIVGGLVRITGRGTTMITASQSGDSVYKAATAVTQLLVVYQLPTVKTENIQVALDESGNASITPQEVDNGSVSYSGALTLSLDRTNFTCADIGSPITVTLTATDADGHSDTGTAQVSVIDNVDPVITAPAAIILNADNGACAATNVSPGVPVTSDNCGVQSVTNDAPASFPVGSTVVTWTVTDIHNNKSTAQQTVTVADNQKPTLNAPSDQSFCYSNGGTYTVPSLTATDNCGVASVSYVVSGATTRSGTGANASGAFNAGVSIIVWKVSDVHGNESTDTTKVTVNAALSATIPDVYAMNPAVDAKNTIYIGYGPAALTITAAPQGGTSPYSYFWNSGAATASVSVSTAGTYSVTVTDSKGCTANTAIVMKTLDVRCGNDNSKVMICHNKKTICVSSDAVQDHLNHGDYLGDCALGARQANTTTAGNGNAAAITVFPNPVNEMLTIQLGALNTGAVMQLYNGSGVLVKTERLVTSTTLLSVKTLPAGIYYIRIKNGETVSMHKIVKL